MNRVGAFALDIGLGDAMVPARLKIALWNFAHGVDGRVFITPECTFYDEVEGHINALQTEPDELRDRAKRVLDEA